LSRARKFAINLIMIILKTMLESGLPSSVQHEIRQSSEKSTIFRFICCSRISPYLAQFLIELQFLLLQERKFDEVGLIISLILFARFTALFALICPFSILFVTCLEMYCKAVT